MADSIEMYLTELRAALVGADPALVQDAVYDAEEYLRSAAAEGGDTPEAIASAIEKYGTPDEIAVAYRETEATVAAALRRPTPVKKSTNPLLRFFGVIADPGAWGALFYMLLSLATGILYFTAVVTGFSLSAGLMVLIVGIPVALLFIGVVRAISLAEGRMVEGLLGVRMPRRPRTIGVQGNLWERLKSWFADYRTWTTMLYMLLMLPIGITYFTVMVTGLSVSLALIAAPIAQWILNTPVLRGWEYGWWIEPWGAPFFFLGGALGFFVTMWLAKGVGYLHGMFAKVMLVGRFEGSGQ
jgi:uncharacterized membrane protein